ncbi:MAG: hypothetical protein ACYCPT_08320 [Acidimicrobiales bacterium]
MITIIIRIAPPINHFDILNIPPIADSVISTGANARRDACDTPVLNALPTDDINPGDSAGADILK